MPSAAFGNPWITWNPGEKFLRNDNLIEYRVATATDHFYKKKKKQEEIFFENKISFLPFSERIRISLDEDAWSENYN